MDVHTGMSHHWLCMPFHNDCHRVVQMSRLMRETVLCIYENKAAGQRGGNRAVNHRYKDTTKSFLNLNFHAFSHLLSLYSTICVYLFRNPVDKFSRDTAKIRQPLL